MSNVPAKVAETRLAEALATSGASDPRDHCRETLRALKRSNPAGYEEGVAYYQHTLIPSIANRGAAPLEAWRDYGLLLGRLTAPGRPVAVNPTGRSRAFEPPGDPDDVVLHMPDKNRVRPVLVALPAKPSPAQQATVDWLVTGRRALREESPRRAP